MRAIVLDYNYLGDKEIFSPEIKVCKEHDIELTLERCTTEDEIINAASTSELILCCGNPPITQNVISNLPKATAYIRYGIGVNSVDIEAATKFNKLVYNMPGFCIEELAMHSSAMILNILRNINYYDHRIRDGEWPKAKGPKPRRLSNMTVGLFGFGGSAIELARIFKKGFGSNVIAYDPFLKDEIFEKHEVKKATFEELIETADIISIHAPLNDETRHIFNKNTFKKMKQKSILINIARGGIINQKELVEALETGEIGFAGLDVFELEPILSNDRILKLDNIIMTPHSGFYGVESLEIQHHKAASLIKKTLVDKEIVFNNLVNKTAAKNFKL
ncbi:C-terminal binding protein [Gudongella sp. DL1XJH-153]|uniref:C-terminal binding protein n=1 Tax=Gudongella sp. DL1XJH-153 TaxID=3409804 RepID=UPI003BB5F0C9